MNSNFTKDEDRMFIKSIENIQKYLSERYNPHVKMIIDSSSVEILEGIRKIIKKDGVDNEG
ncbi:hypothetical protein [Escherichia coli]|uniref:hypothetical protein n=1 Tax=Escherichia coli TaxID=562 RepID=UPI0010C41BEB|nr:hypothetical protein [Escherichia coli]GDJ45811.1 hypothetical protein BvCmsKSNP120_02039 [Escherichia coli]